MRTSQPSSAIGRSPLGPEHEKLCEIVRQDLFNYAPIEEQLRGYDTCFFCLGVSSAGKTEADYRRITYDLTLAAAQTLAKRNPNMTFIYISGAGTDSTESGGTMWARVKGQTENTLLRLPCKATYVFRPGFIQPLHGIKSKTNWYRVLYAIVSPIYPVLQALFPKYVITTEQLGRAMIYVAKHGAPKHVLEVEDIHRVGSLRGSGKVPASEEKP
jgi:uncharacterized protein YbjT (DUF2867 family)